MSERVDLKGLAQWNRSLIHGVLCLLCFVHRSILAGWLLAREYHQSAKVMAFRAETYPTPPTNHPPPFPPNAGEHGVRQVWSSGSPPSMHLKNAKSESEVPQTGKMKLGYSADSGHGDHNDVIINCAFLATCSHTWCAEKT
jgi:hypothetical protein